LETIGRTVLLLACLLSSCGGGAAEDAGPATAILPPPNVLLVVVDTLRVDHLTPYGHTNHDTTPVLQSLVEDEGGIAYRGMLGSSSWTKPGVATLFTGLDPKDHGVMRLVGPGSRLRERQTLAAEFSRAGYSTGCVMSNFLLSKRMGAGFDFGFDFYDDTTANRPDPHRGSTAQEVTDSGLQWLQQREAEQPWMMVLHYFDPHASFEDHPEVDWASPDYSGWVVGGASTDLLRQKEKSLSEADRQVLGDYYDEEIHAVDAQLGRVVAALKEQGIWEQTVVLFTSDHGEELGERGHIGHTQTLLAELVDLPCVVRVPEAYRSAWELPESKGGGYAMRQVYPALLGVAGVPLPEGRSLEAPDVLSTQVDFVPIRRDHVEKYVQKRAVRRDGMHFVVDTRSGEEQMYDLRLDPKMMSPLPREHESWAEMRTLLDETPWWEAP
jgi:arylsulfatase A-like enzyme